MIEHLSDDLTICHVDRGWFWRFGKRWSNMAQSLMSLWEGPYETRLSAIAASGQPHSSDVSG